MKKDKQSGQSYFQKDIDLHQKVLCACNGLKCGGICRENHLQNNRTGICISAHNPPRSHFIRTEKSKTEMEYDVY